MAKRVFELAKELGVKSKAIVEKCQAEGLDIKNHMATVSAGLQASIRDWFSDTAEGGSTVETSEHVDLEKARKEAKKARRRAAVEAAEAAEAAAESENAPDAAPVAEAPAVEVPAEAEAPAAEAPAVEEPVEAEAPAAETPPAAAPQPPAPEPPAEVPAAEVQPPQADRETEPAPEAAPPARESKPEPQPEAEPEDEDEVKPAGPQVVPRPAEVKGPRVVRVEKPEPVRAPRRRPPVSEGPRLGGGPMPGGEARGGDSRKKSKRRSPRRRGGRSGDAVESQQGWRDQDLAERNQRLAAASGGSFRMRRAIEKKGPESRPRPKQTSATVSEPITIRSLSEAIGIKSSELIRTLMGMGQLATINQFLDAETAQALAMEFGVELTAQKAKSAEDDLIEQFDSREKGEMRGRAPVVTFLGHVDHGKTSLLDRIRNEKVASGEAGGITQHTGAYRYDEGDVHVTFLDTPGHEAFTAMRSRGANMTDVVVLVVAADDGVMPQTAEAINHAKAAEVPIVVALNKVDLPNANIQRALAQLAEHELTPQQWGGDTEIIETSAQTGQGVDTLLETLSLEAELLDLKADPEGPATGYVIEAEMKPGLGVVARLLILDGTLHQGEILLAGQGYGRVRAMTDATGQAITEAGPSTPVEVSGLDEVPVAGDRFYIVEALDTARSVAEDRRERSRIQQLATAPHKSLESLLNQIEAGESNQLPVIIKADVQGSVEALVESLKKLGTEEVQLNILHAGVGAVSTGDVTLAEASSAIILGFNVVSDATARKLAEQNGIDIRLYRVIYDLIEDMRKALEEGLAPEISQKTLGRAEVRQVFKISRVGTIAGCIVADGVVNRNAKVRITRGGIVVADERRLDSLKRFKDDVREVRNGMECGLKVAGFDDLKEGDILEFYEVVQVARTL